VPFDGGLRLQVRNGFETLPMHMTIKQSCLGMLWAIAFAAVTAGLNAQEEAPPRPAGAVSVNDLAAKPGAHLGPVQVVGVVAAVSAGKGFVLVDPQEYAACGLSCLAEAGTAKIPVRWDGAAPKLEQTLRVAGTLSQTDQGLKFVAQELSPP
jgi:hypothetical protein